MNDIDLGDFEDRLRRPSGIAATALSLSRSERLTELA